ncbi:MAG: sulfite oxidase [Actinomycetota bacterium]|nr:sulfite oxidase [Actinomycetota bacterium]
MERRRDDGIGLDELALAARNHGMPLEAMRADITPAGMHYLLMHYDVPFVDPSSWALSLGGFQRPMDLTLDELRARPAETAPVTLECAGNGRAMFETRPLSQPWLLEAVGTAEWTGTPLAPLLEEAGIPDDTIEIVFTGLDRGLEGGEESSYERSLPIAEAMRDDVLLVYEMNGQPLLPQHGAPLRLVVPGWYGMTHVKWLGRIAPTSERFEGYQQAVAYRLRSHEDEPGRPLERMRVRSLMVPPGLPTFPERERVLSAGSTTLEGRAWSGSGAIERVEVSVDGCATWTDAELEPSPAPYAWHRWTFDWTAPPGEHDLACRATDAAGATQPLDPEPNLGGYANNAVHRVRVTVTS